VATKSFAFITEPHIATVNGHDLLFEPEVMGDEFMDAFTELKTAQAAASGIDLDDLSTLDPAKVCGAARGLRLFVARLMLPEGAVTLLGGKVSDGSSRRGGARFRAVLRPRWRGRRRR
jgi:hypothetical protein